MTDRHEVLLLLLLRSERRSAALRPLIVWLLLAERLAAAERGPVPRSVAARPGPARAGARPRAHPRSLAGRRPRG